jgi:ribonucleoside-diphosphate reductase subunit M2
MASLIVPTTPISRRVLEATPSKKAAAALQARPLDSPTKLTQKSALIDDARLCLSPDSETETDDLDLVDLHKRFVGDIDLPESEEPLLKESKCRFVLFPIPYHEIW